VLQRIPVRWRIAGICAALTFVILVVFALVLGNLVGDRIRHDREQELEDAARALAAETRIGVDLLHGVVIESPRIQDFAMADDAVIRLVDSSGRRLANATTDPAADLGPPSSEVEQRDGLSVASEPVRDSAVPAYVQYARPDSTVEATIDRLWFFLGAGVLGGSLLALLAGFAVADRAMRPIASLTALAREITTTRDPSRRLPVRAADDEIGELARTMDGMLEALDDARGERERAFERQREFVADASHELRTPLTSVQANLELLRDSSGAGEDDREAIDSALASTRRMSRLVSDLLLLARADAGRRAARTVIDFAATARGAHDEVQPLANERTIRARIDGPLEVRGNPDELHRLVLNLLENAVRHTPTAAAVTLTAGRDGGQAVLEVSDDGPGIAPEQRQQVFQRFVRGAGPADTVGGGGSGLGLAIVRAVAHAHGGSVELGESPEGGARFTVRLPLAGDAEARREAPREDATRADSFRGA
jgi:two-component system OmpR family sensor kinase